MLVKAKAQLAYNKSLIQGGEIFEIQDHEYEGLKTDVVIIAEPQKKVKEISEEEDKQITKESNKQVKKSTVKTK